MRQFLAFAVVLTSILLMAVAMRPLLYLDALDGRSIITLAQWVVEITIGLAGIFVASKVCGNWCLKLTLAALLPMTAQQLWYLWRVRNEDIPSTVWATYFIYPVMLSVTLFALLVVLPRASESNNFLGRFRPGRLAVVTALLVLSLVPLPFSLFSLFIGADLYGAGMPSIFTSLFAISGALIALLFAFDLGSMRRRIGVIVLFSLLLSIRFCRAEQAWDILMDMSLSWQCFAILIDVLAPTLVLLLAIASPTINRCVDLPTADEPT